MAAVPVVSVSARIVPVAEIEVDAEPAEIVQPVVAVAVAAPMAVAAVVALDVVTVESVQVTAMPVTSWRCVTIGVTVAMRVTGPVVTVHAARARVPVPAAVMLAVTAVLVRLELRLVGGSQRSGAEKTEGNEARRETGDF